MNSKPLSPYKVLFYTAMACLSFFGWLAFTLKNGWIAGVILAIWITGAGYLGWKDE